MEEVKKVSKFKQIIQIIFGSKTKETDAKSETKEQQDSPTTSGVVYHESLEEKYLFDFKNYSAGYSSNDYRSDETDDEETRKANRKARQEAENKKLVVKPKDVLVELETVPTPFNLNGLDEKISILKDKEKLITQYYAKREVSALIERLENRKKYVENKVFFDNYQNTTDEKIDKLLSGYKLVMKTSDIFIPDFPDDAIETMTAYTKKCEELFGKKPIFYVIAEESKFKKSYEKRDPILLVQSPFGFFWQILGAWDEEMILLGEL